MLIQFRFHVPGLYASSFGDETFKVKYEGNGLGVSIFSVSEPDSKILGFGNSGLKFHFIFIDGFGFYFKARFFYLKIVTSLKSHIITNSFLGIIDELNIFGD